MSICPQHDMNGRLSLYESLRLSSLMCYHQLTFILIYFWEEMVFVHHSSGNNMIIFFLYHLTTSLSDLQSQHCHSNVPCLKGRIFSVVTNDLRLENVLFLCNFKKIMQLLFVQGPWYSGMWMKSVIVHLRDFFIPLCFPKPECFPSATTISSCPLAIRSKWKRDKRE